MRLLYGLFIIVLFVVALPLFFAISVVISAFSGLPVLFCQRRIGLNGKPFTIYKFRTMRKGAQKEQYIYRKLNEASGPVFKIRNDPRFTRVGKFLSHAGLDELPQLWNVLKGDMALIGPRPLPVEEAAKLLSWMKRRYDIVPGIISPWILEGHNHSDFAAWMKSDIAYVQNKSYLYDAQLTFRAIVFLIRLFYGECCAALFHRT